MDEREKIIKIIEKNGTYNGRSFSFDYYVIQPNDLADALIEAGCAFGIDVQGLIDGTNELYVKDKGIMRLYNVYEVRKMEHRAEVAERAFDNIMRAFHELLSAIFPDKKIDLDEWKKDNLANAEKELAEEKNGGA